MQDIAKMFKLQMKRQAKFVATTVCQDNEICTVDGDPVTTKKIKLCTDVVSNILSTSKQRKKKPFVCDYEGCTYVSTNSGHLKTHKRTHTGEKPYVCDFEGCNYKCAQAGGLETHKRTHTGEKPYVCGYEGCN